MQILVVLIVNIAMQTDRVLKIALKIGKNSLSL